jgi:hypothetical protein
MTVAPGVDTTGVDIEGAKKAYYGFVRVGDKAILDPERDWTSDFRKYAIDPARKMILDEIQRLKASKIRIIGHASYVAEAVEVAASEVRIEVCVNNGGQDVVDGQTGNSIKDEVAGSHPQQAEITRSADGHWYVKSIQGDARESC